MCALSGSRWFSYHYYFLQWRPRRWSQSRIFLTQVRLRTGWLNLQCIHPAVVNLLLGLWSAQHASTYADEQKKIKQLVVALAKAGVADDMIGLREGAYSLCLLWNIHAFCTLAFSNVRKQTLFCCCCIFKYAWYGIKRVFATSSRGELLSCSVA